MAEFIAIIWNDASQRHPDFTMTHDPEKDPDTIFDRAARIGSNPDTKGRVIIAEIVRDQELEINLKGHTISGGPKAPLEVE